MRPTLRPTYTLITYFWKIALRSPAFLLCACIASLVCASAVYSHAPTLSTSTVEVSLMLAYLLLPLLLGSGIVDSDFRNGYTTLWHTAGLKPTSLIIAKTAFLFSELTGVLLIPYTLAFGIAAHSAGDYSRLPIVLAAFLAGLLQLSSVLVLLSTLVPGRWNSMCLFGSSLFFFNLPYMLGRGILRIFSGTGWHLSRVLFMSPYLMVVDAAGPERHLRVDLSSSLLVSLIAVALACLIYRRNWTLPKAAR